MRKLRSDALWHRLTAEQQAKIQHWFFDERLSYRAVHQRMRDELGIRCALSIIGPMYHHCHEERSQQREAVIERMTEILTEPGASLARVPVESLTVISGRLLHRAMFKKKGEAKEIAALAGVMLKAEEREIHRERLDLARQKIAFQRLMCASQHERLGRINRIAAEKCEQESGLIRNKTRINRP